MDLIQYKKYQEVVSVISKINMESIRFKLIERLRADLNFEEIKREAYKYI